jgi:hypothetical protein
MKPSVPRTRNVARRKRRKTSNRVPSIPKPGETLFKVHRITRSRLARVAGGTVRTEFHVKWVGEVGERVKFTWEPMEAVSMCPLLLEEMEEKVAREQLSTLGDARHDDETLRAMSKFPVIRSEFKSKFALPAEFIPHGNETVQDIFGESNYRGVMLWSVKFMGKPGFYFIRKCVMEYYFPVESAFFHENMARKERGMSQIVSGMSDT